MDTRNDIERIVGERFKDAHLANLLLQPEDHKSLLAWIKRPRNFLIFMGGPGSGKTYAAVAINKYLYDNAKKHGKEYYINFFTQHILYDKMRELISKNWTLDYFFETLKDSLLLTIDDFGSTRNNEWQIEQMTNIIDNRYKSNRATIITTNLSMNEIGRVFHPRIQSRLSATENLIISDWDNDLRKEGY